MITSLQTPLSFVAAPDSLAPVLKRYPFLHEVAAAQPSSEAGGRIRCVGSWSGGW